MTVGATAAAKYLRRYVEAYRSEYNQFTQSPPRGGGYPPLAVSPYLTSPLIRCYLANDGAVVVDESWQPAYQWYVAGGPALMVDFPETRTPPEVTEALKSAGILGKPIGIYRIVAQGGVADEVWNGDLGEPTETAEELLRGGSRILVSCHKMSWQALIQRLTYGAFCLVLDLKLETPESDYWRPRIVRDLGFLTADRKHTRFYHYLELLPHTSDCAWDQRTAATRVRVTAWLEHFYDRLSRVGETITKFAALLAEHGTGPESMFQDFLKQNPILLDVYAEAVFPKPRLVYPKGQSPTGKAYVEPDFIIRYPGNAYKLIELERPSKNIATQRGETRAEINQASFQVAEWKAYVANHYDLLRDAFPGISQNFTTMIVISRATQSSVGAGHDRQKYMEVVRQQSPADEVFTYDDLLARASQAYTMLAGLSVGG